jgi:prepilin-type N-terminal cleavage/methylation domain-containing protein
MLNKLKKTNNTGFTIIEVMIVLAIAGLILLIVFLAVPALQRNSRNTSRKTDVSALLTAMNEFGSNNNGTLPTAGGWAAPAYTFNTPAGSTSEARLGYYVGGPGTANSDIDFVAAGTATAATTLASATTDYVIISTGTVCATGNTGASIAGTTRGLSAVYEIETGTGTYHQQCQQS